MRFIAVISGFVHFSVPDVHFQLEVIVFSNVFALTFRSVGTGVAKQLMQMYDMVKVTSGGNSLIHNNPTPI